MHITLCTLHLCSFKEVDNIETDKWIAMFARMSYKATVTFTSVSLYQHGRRNNVMAALSYSHLIMNTNAGWPVY